MKLTKTVEPAIEPAIEPAAVLLVSPRGARVTVTREAVAELERRGYVRG